MLRTFLLRVLLMVIHSLFLLIIQCVMMCCIALSDSHMKRAIQQVSEAKVLNLELSCFCGNRVSGKALMSLLQTLHD